LWMMLSVGPVSLSTASGIASRPAERARRAPTSLQVRHGA
jgi:hypothetical protein